MPTHARNASRLTPNRALSDEDKRDLLQFFELARPHQLRAVIVALIDDSKLGAAILGVMRQDILPRLQIDVADLRMATTVKRLCKKCDVAEPGLNCSRVTATNPYKPHALAPTRDRDYEHRLRPLSVYVDPAEQSRSQNVNQKESGAGLHLTTTRATKKRKLRESISYRPEVLSRPTTVKQRSSSPAPPCSVARKASAPSKPAARPLLRATSRKENEKAVPVEAVASRILQRCAGVEVIQTSFANCPDATVDDAQPSRPENPLASILSDCDHRIAPVLKRLPITSKVTNLAQKPTMKAISPTRVVPTAVIQRRPSLSPQIARVAGDSKIE